MKQRFLWSIPAVLLLAGCASDVPAREDVRCEADAAAPAAYKSAGAVARRRYAPAAGADMARESAPASNFAAVEGRQVAFSATLRISSPDVAQALRNANAIARKTGGYAATVTDRSCTLKIPVKNAETALAELEKLGSVNSREISAEDVTDTIFDLDMRIANLEKLHKRLTELVEKAAGIKDVLAVEKELSRVTGELERLKATRLNLQKRVDFVTFRIYFNASAAVEVKTRRFLLPQATRLGLRSDNLTVGGSEAFDKPFDFDLPKGFIAVTMRGSDEFFAIDDQDTVISAVSFVQIEGADLEFWQAAIARALRELCGYEVTTEIKTAANGDKYAFFRGERLRGKTPMRYEASCRIVTHWFDPDEVHIVEVLGTKERMEKIDLGALHDSVE